MYLLYIMYERIYVCVSCILYTRVRETGRKLLRNRMCDMQQVYTHLIIEHRILFFSYP